MELIRSIMLVNPARAGMIPKAQTLAEKADGKPRASGDDPWYNQVVASEDA